MGTVNKLSLIPERRSGRDATRYYTATVSWEEPPKDIDLGTSARVTISTRLSDE